MGEIDESAKTVDYIMFRDIEKLMKRYIFNKFNHKQYIMEDIKEDVVIEYMNNIKRINELSTRELMK